MLVDLSQTGHVAIIRLEDRARRNALSRGLIEAALDALERSRATSARAVVITGYEKTFSAGADISDLLDAGWMTAQPQGPTPHQFFSDIEADPRPVIAAVNGLALGGGFELAMCCDLVFAASTAKFVLPELGLGVIPNTALSRLRRLCGEKFAADLILSQRAIDADAAHSAGIASRVFDTGDLLDRTVEVAESLVTTTPPSALAVAKRMLRQPELQSWADIEASLQSIDPGEWREGLGAFVDKRTPDFDTFWARHR